MKITLFALCAVVILAIASASEEGYFLPKAFYTLNANGEKSEVHSVSPHTAKYLRRLRRDSYSTSYSSSSSSSSDGGPVYFSSQQTYHETPSVSLDSRFGGDVSGGSVGGSITTHGVVNDQGQVAYHTISSPSGSSGAGKVTTTTGVIDETGKVTYKTEKTEPKVDFSSRFGGDSSSTSGQGFSGHIVSSSSVVDDKGRVHFKTQEGHF